jgi:hypothetical protein
MLGNVVCGEGVLVDPVKVVFILNMPPPMSYKQFCIKLGHIGYFHRFIRNYANIIASLEKLMDKYGAFSWKLECDQAFDTLK